MKRFLFLITLFYSLNFTAQEIYPLQPIERTSFYAEPLDEPIDTELPSGSITARESGANTIGLTTGELSVSGSGAAVYTVPIAVPKGIGGVAPTLALTYNSQSGNGIAGYGWHLAGLSVISRVGSTMYHNGKITEVNLTNTDQFALDGQRLILKEGTHGESGALYETETFSQLRIKAVGRSKNPAFRPDYFEVLYPDGSKAYYGKDNNSQSPMEYAISYWENAQGVSIRYFYKEEGNCIYIDHIEYGGKGENNLHKVKFLYTYRQLTNVAYVGGVRFLDKQLLSSITVENNSLPHRNYSFGYNTTNLKYERLVSVQESKEGEKCSPIQFRYQDSTKTPSNELYEVQSTIDTKHFNVNMLNSGVLPIDIDGDNYTDFIMYPTILEKAYKEFFIFDNLKKKDASFSRASIPEGFNELFSGKILSSSGSLIGGQAIISTHIQNNKIIFKTFTKGALLYEQYEREWIFPAYTNDVKIISGDFNGDGLTDMMAIERHPNKRVHLIDLDRRKESNYTETIGTFEQMPSSEDLILAMDIMGNGKTNIIHIANEVIYIYQMNDNSQLQLLYSYRNSHISKERAPIIGDYNGDGKMDFLFPIENYNNNFLLLTNKGKGFNSSEYQLPFVYKPSIKERKTKNVNTSFWGNLAPHYVTYDVYFYHRFIPIDINNDGKTDIIHTFSNMAPDRFEDEKENTSFTLYINTQSGDTPSFVKTYRKELQPKGVPPHIIFSSPDEKDRMVDLSLFISDKIETFTHKQNHKEDVLLREVVKENLSETITYRPMSSNYSYEHFRDELFTYDVNYRGINYPYAILENLSQVRLVGKIERLAGNVKVQRIFNYYNGISHTEGLGFLGFQSVGSTNWYEPEKRQKQLLYNHKVMNPYLRGAILDEYNIENNSYNQRNEPIRSYFQKTSYQYTHTLSPNKVFKLQLAQQTTEDKLSGLTTTNNFTYDTDGNLTEQRTQTDGYSQSTRISYLPKSEAPYFVGLPQKKETTTTLAGDSFSTAETFAYDKGLLTTHKTQGNGTGWRTTSYSYDEYGNVTEQTATAENGEQRTKRYTYDPTHRLVTSHTDHEGQVTKFSYNNKGLLERKTSPLGQTTLYTYDLWGRPIQTTDFLGKKTTTHYEFNGSIFKTITENEEGTYSAESYNTLGWLLEKESNDAFNNRYAVSYEYNGIGQQVAVSTPHLAGGASQKVKRTEYDVYGRPTSITSPEGKVTRFTYDKLKTTADDGQQQIVSTRDAQGNIVEHQDNGGTVRYTYFANGNLKTANYSGAVQRITQDGWGRKISLIDPSAGRYTYQYDTWGNLTEETTPKGKTTFNYAQGTDRLTEKHITGDYTDMRIRYTYNADKLLTQIDNQNKDGNNELYTYNYNVHKQLTELTEKKLGSNLTFSQKYVYDDFGRTAREIYTADGYGKHISTQVLYEYQNGEATILKKDSGEVLWQLQEVNEYGAPVRQLKGKTTEVYQYDFHYPVSQVISNEQNSLETKIYQFDRVKGLLNERTYSFNSIKETFGYDTQQRLISWKGAGAEGVQTYDPRGRIEQNSQLGSYEYQGTNYQHQKLITNETGDTHLEKYPFPAIRYNVFKAPEQIYVKDKERISFEYDAFESRAAMYYGNTDPEKQKRRYVKHYNHDGTFEIKHDRTTGLTQFYIYLGGDAYTAPAVLSVTDDSEKYLYLHRDYLGSITLITDNAGNPVERRHFDAWGNITSYWNAEGKTTVPAEGILLDRGYTGHEHLLSVGLINMNARLYDPALHRFLQPDNFVQDPFNTQNFNRYGYVLNNPLLYIDPTGEYGEEGLTPNQQRGLGGLLGSLGYTIKENWPEIKDWIGRNAKSTGQWFEKQGRSVGQWFSKQYNSIKEWFQGSGATQRVVITTRAEFNTYVSNAVGTLMQNSRNQFAPYQNQSAPYQNQFVPQEGKAPGWEIYAGALTTIGNELYYSETYGTWMGKNFKIYKQNWGGNGITGGKNKFAKATANRIAWAGNVLGFWNAAVIEIERRNGEISNTQSILEQGTNAFSTLGGIPGLAWAIGWELGRFTTGMEWYQESTYRYWYNYWEKRYGKPSESNEYFWNYFYENYGK